MEWIYNLHKHLHCRRFTQISKSTSRNQFFRGDGVRYSKVISGVFQSRPNRFIAKVLINGQEETVHVKNTGRCRELLLPGSRVYLSVSDNAARKTKYDLIAVEKEQQSGPPLLINMDSQLPNDVVGEWLPTSGLVGQTAQIRREVVHGKSRFDFHVQDGDRSLYLEVKGCTLEKDGLALFPDAPTERGVKHLQELASLARQGVEAGVIFVIQMKGPREFRPNDLMHPEFGDALREAAAAGVRVMAFDATVTPDSVAIAAPVPVNLEQISNSRRGE